MGSNPKILNTQSISARHSLEIQHAHSPPRSSTMETPTASANLAQEVLAPRVDHELIKDLKNCALKKTNSK